MKIVLDTIVLLQAISSRSIHHWIWEALREEKLTLCITTDIILEYEEVITQKRNVDLAKLVVDVILSLPNFVRVEVILFRGPNFNYAFFSFLFPEKLQAKEGPIRR